MSRKAKGIIVEIGGDTSGLQKSLNKVNIATSNLNKELKQINPLLKLDPKNTEILSQKQTILKEKLEATTEKLKSLTDVQEQTKQKWENYKNVEPQLKKINESIEQSQIELEKLQKEQDKATKEFEKGKISEEQYKKVTESVKQCNDRIKDLKKEQKELSKDTVTTENYRKFQREIIKTKNEVIDLKNETSKWTSAGKNIEEIGTKIDNFGTKVDSLGNKLTTKVTAPLVALGVIGVKSSIELETAQQQVNQIYGKSAKPIQDFANNTAIAYNMSTKDAYKYAQVYGNLIQSITDDTDENATYTQELLKASSVIASSTGRTMEDVMDRIRSGLLGNTEAIEDLGVNVNVSLLESTDAFKKFAGNKSWNQLDFKTQQQIRLFGILEQTTKKYGNEVNKNTSSKVQKLTARFSNLSSKLSQKLLPIGNKLIDKAEEFIDKLGNLSDGELDNIVKIGLMVAAAGPLLKVLSSVTSTIGTVSKGIGTFTKAISLAHNGIGTATGSAATLAKVFQGLTSPLGLAAIGITATVSAILLAMANAEKDTKEAFSNMGNSATDFIKGIDSAQSHLDSFNSEMFASSEEQKELENQMDKVQKGITKICKTASDERRGYTQEEITQLDEYFQKLRELNKREIAIQEEIAKAISQQAIQNAQTFEGTTEEYKVQSQEWLKTAEEQKEKTIALIEKQTIEEVALLNQRFGTKANMQNEAYATEYNKVMNNKQKQIDSAKDEIAQISQAYANGYLERSKQNDGFFTIVSEYNTKAEEENKRHNQKMQDIDEGNFNWVLGKTKDKRAEASKHSNNMKEIWNEMYKNMSDEQEKELGIWLAQVAQTELYGGKIDDETKEIVDGILDSYKDMPQETREAMKNAMKPMLEEMQNKEPSLFAKASGIANGILSRLKSSFDIHSPSRKTRDIFQNVMKGAELGLDDEKNKLNKQVDKLTQQMKDKFDLMMPNMGNINQSIIDRTKTIFTTPQIIFNVQELDEAKLQQCFNYINRKFGSAY